MAVEKEIKTRIIQKHDTSENWAKATNFIPKQGEVIVYDIDTQASFERFKIGDGVRNINDLPFYTSDTDIDLSGYVKSVNGVSPDIGGNVEISVTGDTGNTSNIEIDTSLSKSGTAAESKTVGDIFYNLINVEQPLQASLNPLEFEKGSITTGGVDGTYKQVARARTKGISRAATDIVITALNEVKSVCVYYFDENGIYISSQDWATELVIPAGSYYRLLLTLDPYSSTAVELEEILINFQIINDYKIVKYVNELTEKMGMTVAPFGKTVKPANYTQLLTNMDTAEPNKIYSVLKTSAMDITNWPAGVGASTFITFTPDANNSTYRSQILFDISKNKILLRTNISSEWSAWTTIATTDDVNDVLEKSVGAYNLTIKASNYAELLPDMNSALPNKIYAVLKTSTMDIANWPEGIGYATFITFSPNLDTESDTYKVQLIFDINNNTALIRTCSGNVWRAWTSFGSSNTTIDITNEIVSSYNTRINLNNWDTLLPNMDDAVPNKIYSVLKTSSVKIVNWPDDIESATFVTLAPEINGATFRTQLLFSISDNKVLIRTNVSSKWNGWTELGAGTGTGTGGGGNVVLYVSADGDDNNVGSSAFPLATFNEAIRKGANTIIAEPGTYAQTISVSGVNNLTIRAKKKGYSATFQDGLNPKIILDNSTILTLESYTNEIWRAAYTASANSRMYKVFVSGELDFIDDSGSEALGYNANLWEIQNGFEDDIKLTPVATLSECIPGGYFFYDGEYIYLTPLLGNVNGKTYVVPSDDEIIANFENCDNLVLEDIQTEYGYTYGINIQNCRNTTLTACNAHHSTNGEGIRLDYTNARLTYCKAHCNRNDGFNMHYNGHTELVNCYAKYNHDDGVSHHQGCSGTIIGGEYSYNGSGGITPAFGAEVSVYNALMQGNKYGLQVLGASSYPSRTIIAMNNIMTENTKSGLYVDKNTVIGMNTIHGNLADEIVLGTQGVYTDLGNY